MSGDIKLVDEIMEKVEDLPYDAQESILDMIKAMRFTRTVVERENSIHNQNSCLENNDTIET